MAVRQLESGLWVADVTVGKRLDGSRDRRIERHKTKALAQKAERRLLAEKEIKRGRSYGGILFGDFVDQYFWPQKTKLRGNTVRGYKRDLKLRLLPAFAEKPVEDIDRYAIQKMIDTCSSKKVATNARDTLSSILSLAREMGIIQVNPAGFRYEYPEPNYHDPDENGVWLTSFQECRKIVEWVHRTKPGSSDERMVVLGLGFGLRKGEVLGLDWEHVDLRNKIISIKQSYTEGDEGVELTPPKTPKAYRDIPMFAYVYEIIKTWKPDQGAVVKSQRGTRMHPTTARDRIRRLFRDAYFEDGEPVPRVTQFSMRHSYGTSAINAGMEVSIVSRLMGHKDVTTTYNRYVKQRTSDLFSATANIDKMLGK